MKPRRKDLMYFLLLLFPALIYLFYFHSLILFLACCLVLFEKVIFGRINLLPIGGIEFTSISIFLVTLKHGLVGGLFFVFFFVLSLPILINLLLEDRWVINPRFNPVSFGIGNLVDFACVVLISILRFLKLDLFWSMLIFLLFKHGLNQKLSPSSKFLIEFPINLIFNLALIYYLKPFLVPYL